VAVAQLIAQKTTVQEDRGSTPSNGTLRGWLLWITTSPFFLYFQFHCKKYLCNLRIWIKIYLIYEKVFLLAIQIIWDTLGRGWIKRHVNWLILKLLEAKRYIWEHDIQYACDSTYKSMLRKAKTYKSFWVLTHRSRILSLARFKPSKVRITTL